ncbi:hypothetical protein SERLA73DRAFT_145236, partial [Serpula lacrymans var. lacrymans S7.3]
MADYALDNGLGLALTGESVQKENFSEDGQDTDTQDTADPKHVEDDSDDSDDSVTSWGDGGDIDAPYQVYLDKIRHTINHINAMLKAELD